MADIAATLKRANFLRQLNHSFPIAFLSIGRGRPTLEHSALSSASCAASQQHADDHFVDCTTSTSDLPNAGCVVCQSRLDTETCDEEGYSVIFTEKSNSASSTGARVFTYYYYCCTILGTASQSSAIEAQGIPRSGNRQFSACWAI